MTWQNLALTGATALAATSVAAQDFGGEADRTLAAQLWETMEDAQLVGADAIQALPYTGGDPHGAVLQTFFATVSAGGETGTLVVKRNYGPGEATGDSVLTNPGEWLAAVTVMFRRSDDYAPEAGNWFWAKYLPDGSLDRSPDGTPLAGRVSGCIECHSAARGADHLFTTDAALE